MKSLPEFIEMREKVLSIIHGNEVAKSLINISICYGCHAATSFKYCALCFAPMNPRARIAERRTPPGASTTA